MAPTRSYEGKLRSHTHTHILSLSLSLPPKLLVAEKSGGIHFYDMNTETPIMTLDVFSHTHHLTPPLLSVDWSPSNSLMVGGVASGSWALWDVAQSRYIYIAHYMISLLLKIDICNCQGSRLM